MELDRIPTIYNTVIPPMPLPSASQQFLKRRMRLDENPAWEKVQSHIDIFVKKNYDYGEHILLSISIFSRLFHIALKIKYSSLLDHFG